MNSQTFKEPDFAYPQTVESGARALLTAADKQSGLKADITRLRGTLELCAAQTAIDSKAAFAQPAFIAGQAAAMKDAPKALMLALQARVLTDIYTSDKWKYDRVDAPAEPLPTDIALWSGNQFRAQIDTLLRQAVAVAVSAPAIPLDKFKACISLDDVAKRYFPTVADFVLWQAYKQSLDCGNDEAEKHFLAEARSSTTPGTDPWFYWAATDATASELWETYKQNCNAEGARYLLTELSDTYQYDSHADEYVDSLSSSLKRFPSWYNNEQIKNTIASITRPEIGYQFKTMVAPGHNVDVEVKYSYVTTVEALLYAVPDGSDDLTSAQIMRNKACATAINRPESKHGKTTLSLNVPTAGTYAVLIKVNGRVMDESRQRRLLCTPIMGFAVSGPSDAAVVAVDFTTGMPMADVKVTELKNIRRKTVPGKVIGTTDKNGIYRWKADNTHNIYGLNYQGRDYTFDGNMSAVFRKMGTIYEDTKANVFTDRALYHPGESVSWACVVAHRPEGNNAQGHVMAGAEICVRMFDANSQVVCSDTVTVDTYGRACGTFAIPTDRLTGNYRIQVIIDNNSVGSGNFTVSDFKLPTFEASVTGVERNVPTPGYVRVSGNARTFTGMPVAGAKVDIRLTGAMRWRWFAPARNLGSFETQTGADGTFSYDLPIDSLNNSIDDDVRYKDFIVDVTVTSITAETAAASRSFTMGKPYVLSLKQEEITADTSRPVMIVVDAFDADGKPGTFGVRWELGKLSKEGEFGGIVAEGSARTGVASELSLGSIDAGVYTLRLTPDDIALADTTITGNLVLYNIPDNRVPMIGGGCIFLPETVVTSAGKSVKVNVGIAAPRACLYLAVRSGNDLVKLTQQNVSHGFHNIEIPTPNLSVDPLEVRLITVQDGRVDVRSVTVKAPAAPKVEISAESFRDKLVPATHETWRFRLVKGEKPLTDAAMIATMYNRALEKLRSYGMGDIQFFNRRPSAWLGVNYENNYSYTIYAGLPVDYKDPVIWNTPSYRFIDRPRILYMEKAMLYDMAAPTSGEGIVVSNNMDSMRIRGTRSLIEEECEEEAFDDSETTGGTAENFDYRVAEQLQIFWKPALVADADGNIDLVFDMPDAIGSWMFRAVAWTPDLDAASYMAECMSNKPVMVQPSLPRFLRQGDRAVIPATVYNNSDEAAVVETVVELFDITTGKTTSSIKSCDSIAAGSSAIVKIDIEAGTNASTVGYRVRSRSGNFSDGEQTAIPVLASSATVIESTEFYLNPGDKSFSLSISAKEAADASLTLQYCQNPVWTIVKAMRGLSDGGKTSTGIVGSLFSALTGSYITGTNPAIARALKEWKENPSEEALVSMLAKNEDLKKLVLNQTPWVSTANSQTARMQALSELLDPDATAAAINKNVAALADLQQSDGGFAWGTWSKYSSVWCTETVLITMGIANSLDMLPKDNATLNGMLDKAYSYLQKEAVRPKAPKTDESLALIAAFYPSKALTSGAREVVRATVADIAKNWRKHGTVSKAYDIIILSANGRPALCKDIFESIRQFGVEQPGRGMCFPNVDDIRGYATIIQAYKIMKASDAEIDAMRQWILVRAQATDDLGSYNPDYVIAAVLLTGSNWTSVAVDPAVKVNGNPLAVTAVERNTGYFTQVLTPRSGKGIKLEIGTNGTTPSYGSVVSIRRMPMSEIAARPGADISIVKRVLVKRAGEWVETNEFALGERVRVQLTIQTKRDLEYLTINDERPAAFEPVDQLPGFVWDGSTVFYRENLDASTNLFIGYLPEGSYYITYDMTAATAGSFISGIATAQSQYAPEITAHSGAAAITVK